MKILISALSIVIVVAGCIAPTPTIRHNGAQIEHHIRLMEFSSGSNGTVIEAGGEADPAWSRDAIQAAVPKDSNPADYGARPDGSYWQDTIIQSKSYTLEEDAKITTHTHGVVIYASDSITINGRIDARNLGAAPNQTGYHSTRAATMNLYHAYGETDELTGEPLLWGAGSTTPECQSNGGGYVVLNAPRIILNGEVDAGSDCGQAGIVYLEGNVTGTGLVTASLIIHRGAQ